MSETEYLPLLPQDEASLEEFMDVIICEFSLPDEEDTRDMIATMILHLPQTKARASKEYFADGVRKSLANKAAFDKLKIYKQNREKRESDKAQAELAAIESKEQDVSNSIEQPIQNSGV